MFSPGRGADKQYPLRVEGDPSTLPAARRGGTTASGQKRTFSVKPRFERAASVLPYDA